MTFKESKPLCENALQKLTGKHARAFNALALVWKMKTQQRLYFSM